MIDTEITPKPPAVQNLLDLADKVAIVTGSSGGIGTGIARRFAEAGASVVAHYYRNRDAAEAIVRAIDTYGGEACPVQADVTKRVDVEQLLARALEAFGRVDILVNNAGVYPLASVIEMTDDSWRTVIDTNLSGVSLCTQVIARHMIGQGAGGAIVNIASIEGEMPAPMHSHYSAAKAGVLMHTNAAARELGIHGIRVNAVSPGLIWRDGLERDWPDGIRRYREAAPLGRLGLSDDVADACLFLASPAARWITGASLRVDGGVMTNTPY
ncbi:MAG: SDR family NAD(P)-dependent oxidoreductase [Acidiferrobacterales bacterium]